MWGTLNAGRLSGWVFWGITELFLFVNLFVGFFFSFLLGWVGGRLTLIDWGRGGFYHLGGQKGRR